MIDNNDTLATEFALAFLLVCILLVFAAAWLGDAVECEHKSCPAGQVPAVVQSYSNLTGAACSCVLQ